MSSLALLAAGVETDGEIAAAVIGGHGELFVQQFDRASPVSELRNLAPSDAAQFATAAVVIGSGAARLVEARGWGEARDALPSAADALKLSQAMRTPAREACLCPRSGRQGAGGGLMATPAIDHDVTIAPGSADQIDAVMRVMDAAFGDRFGEAWTRSQLSGILPMAGVSMTLALDRARGAVVGFSLIRTVAGESELLLIGVMPDMQRRGVGLRLLDHFIEDAREQGVTRVHLEVRDGNPGNRHVPRPRVSRRRSPPQLLPCAGRQKVRRDHSCLRTLVKFPCSVFSLRSLAPAN